MDANFTFPARPGPVPRPQPAHAPSEPPNRESNAIRASVLDAALQLGFGANGGLANWMSNNAVDEEEEDDEASLISYCKGRNVAWSQHPNRVFAMYH